MAPVTLQGPLSEVSGDARAYPVHLLREGDTGLCLFAAAFLGRNDAIHMARNNMDITLVDISERVLEMGKMYEDAWAVVHDAWKFAEWARENGMEWDVVSVDTFTGDATARSLKTLDLWCSLARRVVTATVTLEDECVIPFGWKAEFYERSELASWLVLTRA